MITSEQKDLCVKLYLEECHTIKEILEQTGLKSSNSIYQILDEAGVPRKRKFATSEKTTMTITIQESRTRFLSGMCRLYHGEPENPYGESDEPFKKYMWRNEAKILQNAQDPVFIERYDLDNPLTWSKFFDSSIKSYIHLWTNPKNGESDRQWFGMYCNIRKRNSNLK